MRLKHLGLRRAALSCALVVFGALPAHAALTLKVVPSTAYQYMTTSMFYYGHTVIAGTAISRLTAGGAYSASCISPYTGVLTGQRSLSSEVIAKYNQLYVTIPATVPALSPMPGFDNAPRGSRLDCSYNWTAFAREGTYTIGVPGSSITIGGGEATDSGTYTFVMQKPGTATGNDDVCIP